MGIFAGIIWDEGQEGGDDCLCREEGGKMGGQIIFYGSKMGTQKMFDWKCSYQSAHK